MRVTKRERYALRMMIELAATEEEATPVGVRSIAERQDIAPRYLEQIAADLRRAGLVRAKQGQTGGYVLARPGRRITVGQIVQAVTGTVPMVECLGDAEACDRSGACPARSFWAHVDSLLARVFDECTLDDLVDNGVPSSPIPLSPTLRPPEENRDEPLVDDAGYP